MFPPDFDSEIYKTHKDLGKINNYDLKNHYLLHGKKEGRYCSKILEQRDILKYINLEKCLEIDSKKDISPIKKKYKFVLNKFNINYEKDLISHFNKIYNIVEDDGYYVLIVKDKRYSSDHFINQTELTDVLENHYAEKKIFVKPYIQNKCYKTHDNAIRHWGNDSGEMFFKDNSLLLEYAFKQYLENTIFSNLCNYYFTPDSLKQIITDLNYLKLIDFKIAELYPTVKNSNTFFVVLKK